jgi:hypothetical protein
MNAKTPNRAARLTRRLLIGSTANLTGATALIAAKQSAN